MAPPVGNPEAARQAVAALTAAAANARALPRPQMTPAAATAPQQRHHAPAVAAASAAAAASSSAASTAASLAAADAPPTAFRSASHDEFADAPGIKGKKGGGKGGKSTPSAAAAATPAATGVAARSTLYRSPLTSRPLLRTLHAVLHALVGLQVRIELKNESSVRGRLEEVDKGGNLRLTACVTATARKNGPGVDESTADSMFVPGRAVRYVHLPDRVDVRQVLTRWEGGLDDRLLQYRRRKRQGKFTTREEQERQIDSKERKLADEIRREREAAAAAGGGAGAGEPAPTWPSPPASAPGEPPAKRVRSEPAAQVLRPEPPQR